MTTDPDPVPTFDSRAAEKLVALFRYEVADGSPEGEMTGELLELVGKLVQNDADWCPDGPGYPDALPELYRRQRILAERLLCVLVEIGKGEDAAAFLEEWATSRRQCAARFNQEGAVPLDPAEQKLLAASWEESVRSKREAAVVGALPNPVAAKALRRTKRGAGSTAARRAVAS